MNAVLSYAIFILFCFWIKEPLVIGIIIVLYIWYMHHHYVRRLWPVVLCLFFFFIRITWKQTITKPNSDAFQIIEIKASYVIAQCGDQNIIVYDVPNPAYGDIFTHHASFTRIDSIHNTGIYSFTDYMAKRNIYYALQGNDAQLVKAGTGIRHDLYRYVQQLANADAKQIINAFLYGIQEEEGAPFMVVASGMHLALFMRFLRTCLTRYCSHQKASCICILLTLGISYICVFTPSLLRMLCFQCIQLLFRDQERTDRLGLSILFVLCLAPYMAYDMALLLPVAFQITSIFNVKKVPKCLLSLSVLLPFQFYYYHSCNIWQMLLFKPLRYGYAFIYLCAWLLLINSSSSFIEGLQKLLHFFQFIQSFGVIWYSGIGIWWCIWWGKIVLDLMSYHKCTTYMELAIAFVMAFLFPYINPVAKITYLDVGQGDCTVIQLPYRQGVVLIDVMGSLYKNIPKDIIVPYLHAQGITSIDAVILTHDDYDHSGGIQELQEEISVERIIRDRNEQLTFGDTTFTFMLPDYQGVSENDQSIVTFASFYDTSFLFMGDLEERGEAALLQEYPKLRTDILKVGHHGSKTSSSAMFLHQIHPQLALVSAGRQNRYGHPSKETMSRLENEVIYPLVTAQNGSVTIIVTKYFSLYETASHEFGFLKKRYVK